ncbi:GntR family transcriptional regulator [Mollicutes bacterium LVI A0039]|nr:GntR family transcriptional regulator [Mollicutes bacterium LVI A0039]
MINKANDGLSTRIYEDIKQKIELFEFKPGDRISETTLASLYEVSRTPIKHSLTRLENEELIVVKPQIGTFVSKIDTKHVHEFFTIRMLLEVAILDEVKENLSQKTLTDLQNNVSAQEQLLVDAETNEDIDVSRVFWKLDNSFHKTIFRAVKKEFIWEFILSQSSQFNRFRVISASNDIDYLRTKVGEHRQIMEYIMGEVDVNPKESYQTHLFGQLDSNIDHLKEKYPDYFL